MRTQEERNALSFLGIDDFRHMNKDSVINLIQMMSNIDPEVLKATLDNFPEYVDVIKDIVTEYKSVTENALKNNALRTQAYNSACKIKLEAISKMLEDKNIGFEEKKFLLEEMDSVIKMIHEKDEEDKAFEKEIYEETQLDIKKVLLVICGVISVAPIILCLRQKRH